MIVELAWPDVLTCAIIAVRKRITASASGRRRDFNKTNDEPFDADIAGAIGEFAVAYVLGRFWFQHIGRWDLPDIAGGVEVRARRIPGVGLDLGIKRNDKDESPFVLVHVHRDRLNKPELMGWLWGHEGKNGDQAQNVWYHAPDTLRPIDELVELFKIETQIGF